jgi:hypothetical protein
MKKLGLKMLGAGWIIFGISFLVPGIWHTYLSGIACGLFISSFWVNFSEYKNQ